MFRSIVCRLCVIAFLAGPGSASAHTGFENETDVRIYADRMQVYVRTTYGFAWKILGSRAPNDIGEAGQKIAGPLLAAEAPGLYEVAAGGMAMSPRSQDCVFELDEHVVFVLVYDRPPAWPLALKAGFFDHFDPLTYGTVRIFDQTDAPYDRGIAPLAEGKVFRAKPAFTFDPAPAVEVNPEPQANPEPRPEKPTSPDFRWIALPAALVLVLLWLKRKWAGGAAEK